MSERRSMFSQPGQSGDQAASRPDLSRFKPTSITAPAEPKELDRLSDAAGFPSRQAKRGPGRPSTGRTGQLHPKLRPEYVEKIQAHCRDRGLQHGVFIEQLIDLYERTEGPIQL
jgi:hypothetical protein